MPEYFIYYAKTKQWLKVSEDIYEMWAGKKVHS
jgi:hypothetical protein